jgi:hypothetical protein
MFIRILHSREEFEHLGSEPEQLSLLHHNYLLEQNHKRLCQQPKVQLYSSFEVPLVELAFGDANSNVTFYKNCLYNLLKTLGGGNTRIGINWYVNHSKRLAVVLEVS